MTSISTPLTAVSDHRRDSAGMTYVYPVVSRRARGVSLGINLNTNNACNWRCIYCQVPGLKRGGPAAVDLLLLETELRKMLQWIFHGDYLQRHVAAASRRLVDIAFSGNGEPTSAAEFAAAVALVGRVLDEFAPTAKQVMPMLRLITNGSMLDRRAVQNGIALIGERQGEVWFKLDAASPAGMKAINSVAYRPETVARRLRKCGQLCPTWVQTCLFEFDGQTPDEHSLKDYLELLQALRDSLQGVHLYGLARTSYQPEAARLRQLPENCLRDIGRVITATTGLIVQINP